MRLTHIDPLFNPPVRTPNTTANTEVEARQLSLPNAPSQPTMEVVEGAFEGRKFKMLIDKNSRVAVPFKESK